MTILKSYNPATGEAFWEGDVADKAAVDAAIKRARAAFPSWASLPFDARQSVAEKFRNIAESKKTELTELISRETGKPLWDAAGEVTAFLNKIAISITSYHERTGEKTSENAGVRQELQHRAHGVMAVFGPYNFPAHLPNGHIVPALLAGNTIVFKPSEETPAVGAFMAHCWQEAGVPDGVFNLVQGAKETGIALVSHPDIDGVLFTGSYQTGKAIHTALAGRVEVMLALEMGGNNPLVVWDAEDAMAAASHILPSAYLTTGQRCTCARRLIIPTGKAGDKILEALQRLMARVRIGAYDTEPEPFMGPLINQRQVDNILGAQERLIGMGGIALETSRRLQENLPFVTPGLIDVTGVNALPDDEYFGPFLQVIRVAEFDMAMEAANNTTFGLAAALISDSPALWNRFRNDIRAGIVNWNRPTNGAASNAPFGGVGYSGNHRPSAYYAADYTAWPVARMVSESLTPGELKGLS